MHVQVPSTFDAQATPSCMREHAPASQAPPPRNVRPTDERTAGCMQLARPSCVSRLSVGTAGTSGSTSSSPAPDASTSAPGHGMITRLRDNTRREKVYTDSTVRYDSRRHAFFAAPVSHKDALLEPEWCAAMSAEFSALSETQTWTLVPRPPGVHVVGSKWVFKT